MEKIITATDGLPISIHVYAVENPKASIQIIHGMSEHKARYDFFAKKLQEHGYTVLISDLRGHGKSILSDADYGYFAKKDGVKLLIQDQRIINEYLRNIEPNAPIYMFAHSMGSLIARNFIQVYDNQIQKLILSGAPCYRKGVRAARFLSKWIMKFSGVKTHHPLIRFFAEYATSRKDENLNEWLSYNPDNVTTYQNDPLCGFSFTNAGYITLYELVIGLHHYDHYQVKNPDLPILFLSGVDDRVTGGQKGLDDSIHSLKKVGYRQIEKQIYPNMRHEILNETKRQTIIDDVINFYENHFKK